MKMNKKVLVLALAAIVATGSTTMFAANDKDNSTCTEQCKDRKECKKGDRKDCKKGDCKKGDRKGCDGRLLKGVELTAEQQAALKQYRENKKQSRQQAKEQEREDFMNELKSVLTPEQYQQVEQNASQLRADKENKADRKDGRHGRQERRDNDRREKGSKK